MNNRAMVIYRSATGFTRQYAEQIAASLDCRVMPLEAVSADELAGVDTVVFGGRLHAGAIDGLRRAKALIARSGARRWVVFATGAVPNTATDLIEQMWQDNLSPDELNAIPHFYLQGGLCYERMSLGDRLMMRVFAAMIRKKREKNDYEREIEKTLGHSFDISSPDFIAPLIECLNAEGGLQSNSVCTGEEGAR